jgi:uncharacterized membrane protein YhdT
MDNGYYAGWGTLALINANLGQLNGGSGLIWFLISCVLGPIATIILLFRPVVRPAP